MNLVSSFTLQKVVCCISLTAVFTYNNTTHLFFSIILLTTLKDRDLQTTVVFAFNFRRSSCMEWFEEFPHNSWCYQMSRPVQYQFYGWFFCFFKTISYVLMPFHITTFNSWSDHTKALDEHLDLRLYCLGDQECDLE